MEKIEVIKIGGNIIDREENLAAFLKQFHSVSSPKILVHGGGKMATSLAEKLSITQNLIEGRRVTNAATLSVATMVYAGLINKNIVVQLQAMHCNAIGLSGADGNLIQTKKRNHPTIDFGFVGDIYAGSIQTSLVQLLLEQHYVPVVNAITHDGSGQLLNTNADTIAAALASACAKFCPTYLTYCFEKNGVLTDKENEHSFLPQLNPETYLQLKENGTIDQGMLPKLDNAFAAVASGVKGVRICNAINFINPAAGTQIIN